MGVASHACGSNSLPLATSHLLVSRIPALPGTRDFCFALR